MEVRINKGNCLLTNRFTLMPETSKARRDKSDVLFLDEEFFNFPLLNGI